MQTLFDLCMEAVLVQMARGDPVCPSDNIVGDLLLQKHQREHAREFAREITRTRIVRVRGQEYVTTELILARHYVYKDSVIDHQMIGSILRQLRMR